MSYEVLARQWRPQQFRDVVGQDHVTKTLERAILTGRVAHAYMFVGSRGTGKTTTARIFAKSLNCRNRKEGSAEPCGECDSCREIMAGNSLDVIEIDGASNNNVDQVRELRDNVRYAPSRGPYKIYIIDEVHMLSTGAFNALLKTLEEPPAHVKFCMATTDVHKVPITILSRCQRFDLRRISLKDIAGRLREIAAASGWTVSEEALQSLAKTAEGGLRDAESALDQVISARGEHLEEQDVLDVFGLVSWSAVGSMAEGVLKGDHPMLLEGVKRMDEHGRDFQRVLQDLQGHFRNLLVLKHAPEMAGDFDLTPVQLETLKAQAAMADGEKLLRVMDVLTETANQARLSLSPRTVVEVGLMKAARAATAASLEEVIRMVRDMADSAEDGAPASSAADEYAPVRGEGAAREAVREAPREMPREAPPVVREAPPPPAAVAAAPVEAAASAADAAPAKPEGAGRKKRREVSDEEVNRLLEDARVRSAEKIFRAEYAYAR